MDTDTNTERIIYPTQAERLVIDVSKYANPDMRNERIAELEAALRKVRTLAGDARGAWPEGWGNLFTSIHDIAADELMTEPERLVVKIATTPAPWEVLTAGKARRAAVDGSSPPS